MTLKIRQPMVRDDQATRLREMVARLDHARDAHAAHTTASLPDGFRIGDDRFIPKIEDDAPKSITRSARVIAIASGKGGVGKTSLAVNLCAAFAKRGVHTALLDGDFGLANADMLCGVRVRRHLGHVLEGIHEIKDVLVETEAGFSLAPGASGMSALGRASDADRRSLVDQLASDDLGMDIVVIDCGAGLGDGVLSFMRTADMPIVVTTPEPPAIADSYALIKCLHRSASPGRTEPPAPQLLVNQAVDAAEAHAAARRISAVALRFLGLEVACLGWAPCDSAVTDAVRARGLFVQQSPRSDAAHAVGRIARRLGEELNVTSRKNDRKSGVLCRLFWLTRRKMPK